MQYINTINYFAAIGHGHPDIASVVIGDYTAILELEKSGITYPVMFIETPEIGFSGNNDHLTQVFQIAITFADQVPPMNAERERYVLARTHELTKQLIQKMAKDQADDILSYFDLSQIRAEPVELMSDHIVGWRSEIPMASLLCAPAVTIAPIIHPSFAYTFGDLTCIEDENTTLDGYERYFKIYIDGAAPITSIDPTLVLAPGFTRAYVELIYMGKYNALTASIDIQAPATDYQSKPYSLNPFMNN